MTPSKLSTTTPRLDHSSLTRCRIPGAEPRAGSGLPSIANTRQCSPQRLLKAGIHSLLLWIASSCFADQAYFTAHNNGNATVSLQVGYREVTELGTSVWYGAIQFALGPGGTLSGSVTTGYREGVEMVLVLDDGSGTILDDAACLANGGSVDLYVVSNNKPANDGHDRGNPDGPQRSNNEPANGGNGPGNPGGPSVSNNEPANGGNDR